MELQYLFVGLSFSFFWDIFPNRSAAAYEVANRSTLLADAIEYHRSIENKDIIIPILEVS